MLAVAVDNRQDKCGRSHSAATIAAGPFAVRLSEPVVSPNLIGAAHVLWGVVHFTRKRLTWTFGNSSGRSEPPPHFQSVWNIPGEREEASESLVRRMVHSWRAEAGDEVC